MKKEFWIEKWQNNQTGFHKNVTHPLLIDFVDKLNLSRGDTIFVPLCGKTIDMLWLNDYGFHVIAVEVSQLAVEQFFAENKVPFEKSKDAGFNVYQYRNITIYQGDFFELTKEQTRNVSAIYDRAALIALPDELASKYVDKMQELISCDVLELLITLEFVKTSGPVGPPFSAPDSKVKALFNNYSSISILQENDIISREPKFKSQGCTFVYERVYLIRF